jgi:hypothetical protein
MNHSDVPNAPSGSHPMVSWLKRIRLALIRRTILPGIGYKIRETPTGYVLEILPAAGRPGDGIKFKISETSPGFYSVGPGNVITTGEPFEPTGINAPFAIGTEPGRWWFYLAITSTAATVLLSRTPPQWSVNAVPIGYVENIFTPFIVYQHQRDHLTVPCA